MKAKLNYCLKTGTILELQASKKMLIERKEDLQKTLKTVSPVELIKFTHRIKKVESDLIVIQKLIANC